MNLIDRDGPWGAHAPSGIAKFLVLAKRLGLARGSFKKVIARLWSGLQLPVPVDIRYANLKFRLNPWDNVVENKMLFGSKTRDGAEIQRLREFVGSGGVLLDIGANIGYYALMAAHHGARKVLAFEPNPLVYDRLQFNIEANELGGCVVALPIALGDRVALMNMIVSDRDLGGSHICNHASESRASITVEMRPLGDVLAEEGMTHVDALKIDVEGLEDAVLFPFFETSDRGVWPRLVIIEHTSRKQWKRDILAWMLESGYRELERTRSNAMLRLVDK